MKGKKILDKETREKVDWILKKIALGDLFILSKIGWLFIIAGAWHVGQVGESTVPSAFLFIAGMLLLGFAALGSIIFKFDNVEKVLKRLEKEVVKNG